MRTVVGERRASVEEEGPSSRGASQSIASPSIVLPKGGGAIRSIGEKFAANPVTGTGSMSVPIYTSPGRSGFGPELSLSYDSGSGNGPFGFGWNLSLPRIARKTDKGLPRYRDNEESDVFLLSGAEDLVPVIAPDGSRYEKSEAIDGELYVVHRYRPRIERLFARIERWTRIDGDIHWRSISKDNILTVYGKDARSRIYDPASPKRVFSWLICETRDDRGNAVVYEYKAEDGVGADLSKAHERNRGARDDPRRRANHYLKRVRYGNRTPLLTATGERHFILSPQQIQDANWMFEVVLDYGEHHAATPRPGDAAEWAFRNDPFSSYRAGFEVRTARLCRRVLMFHHFQHELDVGNDCLVKSTDFVYSHQLNPGEARAPVYTFLRAVMHTGYKRDNGGYVAQSMPAVDFAYSMPVVQDELEDVDPESLENLPIGLDGAQYRWTDLHGEGIPGILTEQDDTWYYKRNVSPWPLDRNGGNGIATAVFAPAERVATKPNLRLASGAEFMDLAGDGLPDLVMLAGPMPGLYEHDVLESWQEFRPFSARLNRDLRDPNVKLVDVDGDGHADVLITENDAFIWHPSLAEEGFGEGYRVEQALDEEQGPRLLFADASQSIHLADMSGDGLTDLVRIRNGEVCYWPNLGYGRFGAKVSMDHAPLFDSEEEFDQKRIRLADVDGSGTVDIIYLHRDGARLYFNQSGNGWSAKQELTSFPQIDDASSIMAVDLLGNGTACLVWSSSLPAHANRPMKYINLVGGQKPHLLVKTANNLGAETRIAYAPSTKFYLKAKHDGRPWVTRLPFPVHVVERVEVFDHVSRNCFVSRYAYHHGYFDGEEREFRGFGMVEQWDTETFAALTQAGELPVGENHESFSHIPPVYTRTWFHTGIFAGEHVSDYLAGLDEATGSGEYYREPAWRNDDDEARKHLLPDTVLPTGLTVEDKREACRALKGTMLRQETYALDGSGTADYPLGHPYAVTEQNFAVRLLQERGANRHPVFLSHALESINTHYERNPADPRVKHTLTLQVDEFGNVLRSMEVAYPRRPVASRLAEQSQTYMLLTLSRVVNRDDQSTWRRISQPVETRTYEIVKPPESALRFSWQEASDLVDALVPLDQHAADAAKTVPYEQWDWRDTWNALASPGGPATSCLRLVEHVRTHYRPDDLGFAQGNASALLPLGAVESMALAGESYRLALTTSLLNAVFRRDNQSLLPNHAQALGQAGPDGGGYVDLDRDGRWWQPSGRTFCSLSGGDDSAAELAYARQHFFLPHRFRDPFGQDTTVRYDSSNVPARNHNLLAVELTDPVGNVVTVRTKDDAGIVAVRNDYRVLQPYWITDPNGNRTRAAYDAFGLAVGTAVMGKAPPNAAEGDSLAHFAADLTQAQIDTFAGLADPHTGAANLLGSASTRVIYDFHQFKKSQAAHPNDPSMWKAAYAATISRETHHNDPQPAGGLKVRLEFAYSDGFGRVVQKKLQAEPGPVPQRDGQGRIVLDLNGQPVMTANDVTPRWVGSGWTVVNNKGKPVRKYEPFFTDTHRFEFDTRIGVSPTIFYDPLARVVATVHPNHTWEKTIFDPWRQEAWDVNDTMLVTDPRTDADVGEYFTRLSDGDYLPTWHSLRTDVAHAAAFAAQYPDASDRAQDTQAAEQSEVHAATPTVQHADALGRTFLTVAHNRFKYSNAPPGDPPADEFHRTRIVLDIENNQRAVIDAKGRTVVRYDYDMLGNQIHSASMEAGERWMLNDVAGNPVRAWDSRHHFFRTEHDFVRRPTNSFLRVAAGPEQLVGRTTYGETALNPEARNLRGEVMEIRDQAGLITSDAYDFKGNVKRSSRRLAQAYNTTLDWSGGVPLQPETYASGTSYDALNRVVQLIAPHVDQPNPTLNVIQPIYNDANLLEKVHAWFGLNAEPAAALDPNTADLHAVTDVDYDAKGQRVLIDYGNGVRTTYQYDPLTYRLVHLRTRRNAAQFPGDCPDPAPAGWPGCQVQKLYCTYDPAGNITNIRDDAQQTIYFQNKRVEPSCAYLYDAIYRLIEARGREHLGQVGGVPFNQHSYNDAPRNRVHSGDPAGHFAPHDGNAMGRYLERYVYDAVGNVVSMEHRSSDPAYADWTRSYSYDEVSQLEPAARSNRLTSTTVAGTTEKYSEGGNGYDAHGSMLRMPHLQVMQWDFKDQLQMTQRQAVNAHDAEGQQRQGERTWYVYDSSGQRVRKVTESAGGQVKEDRIYLGGLEIYRRHGANPLVRETLHIMDDKQRIALVETRTQGNEPGVPSQLIRFQFSNHLGSASLELDEQARIITYEEYTPYGSTAYQAVRSQTEVRKRYGYTGKERDEESGLYYHGARYYAPWLGRWTRPDPEPPKTDVNLFHYVYGNPIRMNDPTGNDAVDRVLGGLKMVGGAVETAAGVILVKAGAATSWTGVGIAVGAAGVALTAHGADVTVSGARTMLNGKQVDTFTSTGMQAAGMSRQAANITDASISIVGTFGAGGLTRVPSIAAATKVPASGGLVHLTTAENAAAINASQMLGKGSSTIYAGTPSLAEASPAISTLRTALLPSQATTPVHIPAAATGAFQAPAVVGPITVWQRASGAYYSAGAGSVNLTTGAFTKTGAALNQYFFYGVDAAITTTVHGASPLLSQNPSEADGQSEPVSEWNPEGDRFDDGDQINASFVDSAAAEGIPDPVNFSTFEEFSAAAGSPYSEQFLMEQWASVHGWTSSAQ